MKHKKVIICCTVCLLLLQACSLQNAPAEPTEVTAEVPAAIPSTSAPTAPSQTSAPAPTEILPSLLELISTEDLAVYFDEYSNAAMILSDGISSITYHESFAQEQQPPFSTFKILNSMIALEEGIVDSESSLRPWDGIPYKRSEWNQDQDMASAIKHSCLWYYKQLAREIGTDAMQSNLNNVGYGNMDISGGLDTFWLGTSLLISPQEQLDFIIRLYHNQLPFSQENIEYVKSIMRQEGYSTELYGKTGSSGKGHGWFVGYAIIDEKPYFFSTYIEGENIDGPSVRNKTAEILDNLINR